MTQWLLQSTIVIEWEANIKKTKIAFTSCIRYEAFQSQPQWKEIEDNNPDFLFLLGDQIYMDYGWKLFNKEGNGKPKGYTPSEFERIMESKYRQQWSEPHFKSLLNKMRERQGFHGIWDDHDFAWNNACGKDASDEIKQISRRLFHDWMQCSNNRPEVYYTIDIPLARVIFLDNRYYATKPNAENATLLGAAQFEFLRSKLEHDLPYTIICSGLTLTQGTKMPFTQGTPADWKRFKADYSRFCELISSSKKVLFLGGDIHKNKFLPPSSERPCYEIISSGLAVNYFGLPFGFDDKHNWGLVEYDDTEVIITLIGKNILGKSRRSEYRIDSNSWLFQEI